MTDGQNDTLELVCVHADGDVWARIGGNDN